jgi:hypothetical protein
LAKNVANNFPPIGLAADKEKHLAEFVRAIPLLGKRSRQLTDDCSPGLTILSLSLYTQD